MKVASILLSIAICTSAFGTAQGADTFKDTLLSTPTSPEVMAKGLETDGYQLGISAYVWGYPLFRMERIIRSYTDVPSPKPATSYRGGLNQIGWASELATPDAKDMPTANNDTFYMSAVVRLDQPFILTVPDTNDRYYVVNVFNMWQELEHYIGRRTTGTKAGKYALVPPGWEGSLPDGVTRLDVSTDKVWLWGRLHTAQGEPVEPVLALQKEFKLEPLDASKEKNVALEELPSIGGDELGFYKYLAFALKDNKVKAADQALFAQFARIGLTVDGFDPSKLSKETRKGLLRGLKDAPAVVVSSLASTAVNRNGWTWATGLDSFGFNYPLRAMVAGAYLGGNGEKEAMYPLRSTDSEGKTLSGANHYVLKFDREPPVGAFWSLTMYNDADKMLVPNSIHRYKIGPDTKGLVRAADGSITIPIQATEPKDDNAANWLSAPEGNFYVILRLYQPSEEILNGSYELPQLNRVKAK